VAQQSNSAVIDDEYGLETAKPAAATGVTDDKYGLEPADKPTMAPGSFQQRKGGPVLNANKLGIQGSSKKQVTDALKSNAAAGSRVEPAPSVGQVADEAVLGEASGFSGMPESSQPLTDFSKAVQSERDELMEHPVREIGKRTLLGPAPELYGIGKGLVESGGEIGSGMIHHDPLAVAHGGGRLLGQAAQLGVIGAAPETVGNRGAIAGTVSKIARDPITGDLKPGAVLTGKIGGGVAGGVLGGAIGETLLGSSAGGHRNIGGGMYGAAQGARAGAALGPVVLDKMIPARPVYPGAALPDTGEFYENRATDLAKRGKEQTRIDAANEAKLREVEEARQKELADAEKLKEQHAQSLMRRGREQEALDAKTPKPGPLGGVPLPPHLQGSSALSTTPAGEFPPEPTVKPMKPQQPMPVVKTKAQVAAEAEPKIIKLTDPPNEGRPATWTDENVKALAPLGDPDAIAQVRNRLKGNDPLNPGRIPLKYPITETNPLSITKFSLGGDPIEESVRPRNDTEPTGIPVLQPPVVRPTPSVRSMGRPVTAPAPNIPALNFDQSIKVPSQTREVPGSVVPPEPSRVTPSPIPPAGDRWTSDRGAAPGEPFMFLDGDRETAKAAITEIDDPKNPGRATFEAHTADGELLGRFGTAEQAARFAEENVPQDVARMVKPGENVRRGTLPDENLLQVPTAAEATQGGGVEEEDTDFKFGANAEPEPEPEAKETEVKGITAKAPAKGKSVPLEKRFTHDQIEEAKLMVKQHLDVLQGSDKPGVYFDESTQEEHVLPGRERKVNGEYVDRQGGSLRSVKSGREYMPWLKENPKFSPADMEYALRNVDSAKGKRIIASAAEFLKREKMTPEEKAAEAEAIQKKWEKFQPTPTKSVKFQKPTGD
jgi:hypothetical protein